ncbi:MAG: flippase-like domain-containing protein [Chloroflexi bacterium]|nr:flippase-like domain-containing protein [Chloroflexota bacterium]
MKLRLWIGIVVSALLLWYSMRNVDFIEAWHSAQQMNAAFLLPYLALVIGEVALRAWRWQILLAPIRRCSLGSLTTSTIIGLMANNVLPGRAGEFLRAYFGGRMERIPFSACFATVVIDRVFDGLTASALFIAAALVYPLPDMARASAYPEYATAAIFLGYAAALIYVVSLVILVGLIANQTATLRLIAALLRIFPERFSAPVLGWLGSFVEGLGVFRDVRLLLGSLALSVVIWLGYGLTLYLMSLAFDIHLGLADSFVVLVILTIGLTVPSTPGFVGAMEAAIVTGLGFFGVDESRAFAVAVVYHVTQYVPITLWGLLALWQSRIGFAELTQPRSVAEKPQM